MRRVEDDRRTVTIRIANAEHVRQDNGDTDWVRRPTDEWKASCTALRDAVVECGSLRHAGEGVDWGSPSGSLETTWAAIVDCIGDDNVDELRSTVEDWLVADERTAAWFLVTEPDVARGAFLQARPR